MLPKDFFNGITTNTYISITHNLKSYQKYTYSSCIYWSTFVFLQICYFFYKNVAFGFTVFLYEAYASFSGQPAYNDWFLSLFNVFFTSLPVIALGVFDQDVSAKYCLKVRIHFLDKINHLVKLAYSKRDGFLLFIFSMVFCSFHCYTKKGYRMFCSAGNV